VSAKYVCAECDNACHEEQLLSAPNPFYPADTITGCPNCGAAESVERACDWQGCAHAASSGHPLDTGYTWRCWEHSPSNKAFTA
jgi:hypothetical protein